jgi:hypothetical protein
VSKQITLGELTDWLEQISDKSAAVCFDFGSAVPTDFGSWRGAYDQLELGYKLTSYDSTEDDAQTWPQVTVEQLLERCKAADGATYTGWKGGDFTMSRSNVIWVSNDGNASNSGISDMWDKGYQIVLCTEWFDY